MRRVPILLLAALVHFTACTDTEQITQPLDLEISPDILDGAHQLDGVLGNEHFFWLPPMVTPAPDFEGDFDEAADPTVVVCKWVGLACEGEPVLEMTTANGLTLNALEEWYGGDWYVFDDPLVPVEVNDVFRISVSASGQGLGFADLTIVDKVTGQVKNSVGEGFLYLSENNGKKFLKIRFRIEDGAVHEIEWFRQFGTPGFDAALSIAGDDAALYVAGTTTGSLGPQGGDGSNDAFVSRWSTDGEMVWVRQAKGTGSDDLPSAELAEGVAVDEGSVFVAGITNGAMVEDQGAGGGWDMFVQKYDLNGEELWRGQCGSSEDDFVYGIAAAGGYRVYVAGAAGGDLDRDLFCPGHDLDNQGSLDDVLLMYTLDVDNEISLTRTRSWGTPESDVAMAVATELGLYSYVVGQRASSAFVYATDFLDLGHDKIWSLSFWGPGIGIISTRATGVAFYGPGVLYVVGDVVTAWAGGSGPFVAKYQHGFSPFDWVDFFEADEHRITSVSADASGVYVAGWTSGTLPGQSNAGKVDAFVRKYDDEGNEVWTVQFGSPGLDWIEGITIGASGVYVAGRTYGSLPNQVNLGGSDAFVAKLAK